MAAREITDATTEAMQLYVAQLASRRPVVRAVRARCPNPQCGSARIRQHHTITDNGLSTAYGECKDCGTECFVITE